MIRALLTDKVNDLLTNGATLESIAAGTKRPPNTVGNLRKLLRGYSVDVSAFECIAAAVGLRVQLVETIYAQNPAAVTEITTDSTGGDDAGN